MWKYRPEYDTKEIEFEETFDCDYRLGEIPGQADIVGTLSKYIDDNGHEIQLAIYVTYFYQVESKRSYKRHLLKHGVRPYIKIRKMDNTDWKVLGMCRLYIFKPEYLTGYNENMVLSNDEIDLLVNYLNSENVTIKSYRKSCFKGLPEIHYTNWMNILKYYNSNYRWCRGLNYWINSKTQIPDYNKLNDI